MDRRKLVSLGIAFAAAALVVGVPYWSIPLQQLALPRVIWNARLVACAAFAAVACVVGPVRAWIAGLVVAMAVPVAVLVRVAIDTAADPTAHNLWPFEVALALGPGLLAGTAGAVAGALLVRLRRG
ncbi:MAG: hypothetical protein ACTHOH_13050 [Lysobacteraceae bacterium]